MSRLASATAAATGWPPKVKPVREHRLAVHERLGDPVGGDHRAHRRVGRRQALGGRDDVRQVVVALRAEVVTEPAPRADHLVGDQQHAVAVADLAHPLEVALLRGEAAAGVLDRLEDHGGDRLRAPRTGSAPRSRRRPRAGRGPRASGRSWCSARGSRPGASGSNGVRRAGTPVARQRAHRGAVVGDLARDQLVALAVAVDAVVAARASFSADSTASEPPEVKKTRLRSPGARLATARPARSPAGARSSSW